MEYISIYLHIPFCRNLCPFCHFYRVPEIPDWKDYLDAVIREIGSLEMPTSTPIYTIYVGGGTPTSLPPEFYISLFETLKDRFDLSSLAEATLEADGQGGVEDLAGFAQAGFDRISIGVKSFCPNVRKMLGAGELPGSDPVQGARRAGFSSVGLDLIYGIEGQDMGGVTEDLHRLVELDPDHISLYMLEGPEAGEPEEGDPDLAAAMFRESSRIMDAAGYRQYEITNFARSEQVSLHNTVYWEDGDFIGLGPSAHSSVTVDGVRDRWRNLPDLEAYLKEPGSCREELSKEEGSERAREALILGLRMTKGVHRATFTLRYGYDPMELVKPHIAELTELGLIRFSARRVRLTKKGMLLSNEVFLRVLEDN